MATVALSGPISRDVVILSLRYPISRDTLPGPGRLALPQDSAMPSLGTWFHTDTFVRHPFLQHTAR